ncbi:hypothetical protein AK830_g4687 [Neonectria ditissima]|uniref:4-coumarate--CoA ligase-like 7 n=1 Tax=Neonectria ditissima TaxID=78410 RepID=A0A0N8H7H7_9HYPO|nr:hypothetical protein AK830_g4687 [Neonectria ditissima]
MPIQSRWTTLVPEISLQKWLFGSSFDPLPDYPTFIDADQPERVLSFSDFRLWSKKIGLGLQNAGLKLGDRVLLLSGNHILFPSVFIGVLMAGGIVTGASPAFTPRELAYQLRDSEAAFLIVAPDLVATSMEAAKLAGLPISQIFVFDDAAAGTPGAAEQGSSGTTGAPKGVEITHYGVPDHVFGELPQDGDPDIHHADVQLQADAPAYSTLQNHAACGRTAHHQRPCHQSTEFKYDLSTVTTVGCGTAPLAPNMAKEMERLWPCGEVFVRQAWGMTELTCIGSITDPAETVRTDSVGEAAPNGSIKLMDGDKEILEANTRGELWYTGPTVMKGYWCNKKATQETITEKDGIRWLRTGDIAYVDSYQPGGKIHIVDRIKELIKVKGFQVAPAELESLLLERDDIIDAGVVGVHNNGEEVPRAYVVKSPASKASAKDITQWMETRTAKYKWLTGGVVFVDSIPRVPSGKILRRVLRERAQRETGNRNVRASKLA